MFLSNSSNPSGSLFTYTNTGRLGIGTTSPSANLEIKKNFDGSTAAFLINESTAQNSRTIFLLGEKASGGDYGYIAHHGQGYVSNWGNYDAANSTWVTGNDTNGLNIIAGNSQGKIVFGTASTEKMRLAPNGFLGIGTKNPDEKLTVKGTIHCEEVLVDLKVPADYDFEKYYEGASTLKSTYTMPTLEEVEAFTKKNHHLPAMPSAAQIQEEG